MKTYVEYESSDIVLGEGMDPVHAFLAGQMLVIGLTGFKKLPEDGDDGTAPLRRLIAEFLNAAQKSGVSITKSELPDAFKAGGR